MKQSAVLILCLSILMHAEHLVGTTTKIIPRSQSFNAARQMVGWNNPEWGINRKPQLDFYTSFNLTFAYTRSFKNQRLAYCLFGDHVSCNCDTPTQVTNNQNIRVSGSDYSDRSNISWLADYFGLPRDFKSTITFTPRIDNFILDFSLYAGLDAWIEGLYFRIHGPYVNTRWSMNTVETISNPGTTGYFQGYFSSEAVPVENLNISFLHYSDGGTPNINNAYDLYGSDYCETYGPCSPLGDIIWNPLCCSKIKNDCHGTLTANGFAELRFVLGYNFLNDEDGDYHLGLGLYSAAPTGTRVGDQGKCNENGRYLFEPIVGNGKHWELGAQVTAHHLWWHSDYEDNSFGFYLEANITHLFAATQTRCFDLCSTGSSSRYMIAQRLQSNKDTIPLLTSTTDTLNLEFANEYAPVANITSRTVSSTIAMQGDVAFCLSYRIGGFQWDMGYNFWARSCEKLCIKNDCCPATTGDWALKGDQRVYGFMDNTGAILATKLAATDSLASIHQGSNMRRGVDYFGTNPTAPKNFYADNSIPAEGQTGNGVPHNINILPLQPPRIYTSETPILIQECDFNLNGSNGLSNKLFMHVNWVWAEHENQLWTPYLGIGVEVEFGANEEQCCKTDCTTPSCDLITCTPMTNCTTNPPCCANCALSQWGIWLKVGASYH